MMKKLFVLALAAFAMVACVNEDITEMPNGGEITFGDAFINNSTRVAEDPSYTTKSLGKFNVWGYVNETTGTVFSATEVTNNNGVATYDGTQYWAPAQQYYFAAVAGVAADKVTATDGTKPTKIEFVNVDGTQDLLYAYKAQKAAAVGETNAAVALEFNHILSKVKFSFTNGFPTDNVTVNVTGITMTAVESANYNIDGATGAWADQAGKVTLAFGDAEAALAVNTESQNERLVIPAGADQSYKITFTVEVKQGGVSVLTATKESTVKGVALEAGKAYNFAATITPETLNMEAIEFTVQVKDWEEANFDYDITNAIRISTPEGLMEFAKKVNAGEWLKQTVILEEDIDLSQVSTRAATYAEWTPIGNRTHWFAGTFDGQGHKISNYQVTTTEGPAGLFGYARATIKNLKVENVTIKANHYAGAIVGQGYMRIDKCEATNVDITVEVKQKENGTYDFGDKAGGIIGQNCEGALYVTNCKVKDVTIKGYRDLGGVVGMAQYNNTVSGCSADGVTINQDLSNGYETDPAKYSTLGGVVGRVGSPITLENNTEANVVITSSVSVSGIEELKKAIANKLPEGAVINVTEPIEVEENLDLNGNTISASFAKADGVSVVTIAEGKTVVITNGTIASTTTNGAAVIINNGELVLGKGANIVGAPIADGSYPEYAILNAGNLTIEEGTNISSDRGCLDIISDGETVINGGKFTNNDIGSRGLTSHVVYVEKQINHKLTINGGTFEHRHGYTSGGVVICNRSNTTTYVNGGSFSGGSYPSKGGKESNLSDYGQGAAGPAFVVKGGVFSVKMKEAFVADGYKVIEVAGNNYKVVSENLKVVESTEQFNEAITSGGEVMLGSDVQHGSGIANDVNIDLNGNTFEATSTIELSNNADLTMVGGDYVVNGTFGHVDVRPSTAEGSEVVFEGVDFSYSKLSKTNGPCTNRLGSVVEVCATVADAHTKITFKNCTFDNAQVLFEGMSGKTGTFEAEFIGCTFKALTSSAPIYVQNYVKGTIKVVDCEFNLECTSSTASAIYVNSSTSTIVTVTAENNTFNATAATPSGEDGTVEQVKVNGTPKDVKFISSLGTVSTIIETGTIKSGIAAM